MNPNIVQKPYQISLGNDSCATTITYSSQRGADITLYTGSRPLKSRGATPNDSAYLVVHRKGASVDVYPIAHVNQGDARSWEGLRAATAHASEWYVISHSRELCDRVLTSLLSSGDGDRSPLAPHRSFQATPDSLNVQAHVTPRGEITFERAIPVTEKDYTSC